MRRRIGIAVGLVTALQSVLMFGAMILYTPFQEPDETAHFDYVLAHRHGEWWDGPGQRRYQAGVLAAAGLVTNTQFAIHVGGHRPVPRADRRSVDQLGTGPADNPVPDQMVQHPPLYYGLAAGFSYLLPNFASHRFDIQLMWLRIFSVLLMAPIPCLIFRAAVLLTSNPRLGLTAAIIPLSMPSYLRIGASVTNDSLLALTLTACCLLLVRAATGDLRRRTTVALGVAWGLALLTKGFALGLPPAIVVAYLVGADGNWRQRVRMAWPGMTLAAGIGVGIGGWWWVRNVVVYGHLQPNGFAGISPQLRARLFGAPHSGGTELGFGTGFLRLLGQRLWGSLGLSDVPSLPHAFLETLSAGAVVAVVVAVAVAAPRFAEFRARSGLAGYTIGRVGVGLLPLLLVLGIMYAGSRVTYLDTGHFSGLQVRYLLPVVLGAVVCMAVTAHLAAGRLGNWVPAAVLSAGLAFLGACTYRVLTTELSAGPTSRLTALDEGARYAIGWAPFPGAVTVGLAAAGLCLAVATVGVLVLEARRAGASWAGPSRAAGP